MKTEDIKNMARALQQVQEKKLTGNQHKLDMDKDGDIDAKDFAHMRKKKKSGKEEVTMTAKVDSEKGATEEQKEAYAPMPTAKEMKKHHDAGKTKQQIMAMYKGADKEKMEALYAATCMREDTNWPVYKKIMEKRDMHTKGATEPEKIDSKDSPGGKKMRQDIAVDASSKQSNYDDLGHDDASKAGRITKTSPARNGDNKAGDKNVVNPPEDITKKAGMKA